ncbi:hypothetical protein HZC09_03445 [Candidatus Micrarchaeota archaeon]|nr:hypothetical protein [Candidatus Micrarchaeota archaeon]
MTSKFPNKENAKIVIYKSVAKTQTDGFRAALQGYYDRFPSFFTSTVPVEKQGIWVAFFELYNKTTGSPTVPNISDFSIAIGEGAGWWISMNQSGVYWYPDTKELAFREQNNVTSFRYALEQGSIWIRIENDVAKGGYDVQAVDVYNASQVMDYVNWLYGNCTTCHSFQRKLAELVLSSCIYSSPDESNCFYEPLPVGPPWCKGKCAHFYTNDDPDIRVPGLSNRGETYWSESVKNAYSTGFKLDGEYLDGMFMRDFAIDYRKEHWVNTDYPLSFGKNSRKAGYPTVFSGLKLAKKIKADLVQLNKTLFSNDVPYNDIGFGAELADFGGIEAGWGQLGGLNFIPAPDSEYSFRRALAGFKPNAFLYYYNHSLFNAAQAEEVIKTSLFYGIYPLHSETPAQLRLMPHSPETGTRSASVLERFISTLQSAAAGLICQLACQNRACLFPQRKLNCSPSRSARAGMELAIPLKTVLLVQ